MMKNRLAAILLSLSSALLATVVLLVLNYRFPFRISTNNYEVILNEIMSVDFPFRYLTPDNGDDYLAYVHATEHGRGLFLMDLKTRTRTQVPMTNEVTRIFGWSPDGNYLAFIETPPQLPETKIVLGNSFMKEEWVTILRAKDWSLQRLTGDKNVVESRFSWLGTNSYFLVSRRLDLPYAEAFVGSLGSSSRIKISNYLPFMDEMVLSSDNELSYQHNGEIFTLKLNGLTNGPIVLKTPNTANQIAGRSGLQVIEPQQLTHFEEHGFSALRWLRYHRQTKKYLFCATPIDSNWRYLYSYDPQTHELVQLTKQDTYNGQFLEDGNGFAFVGNRNFDFYLCIRPQDPRRCIDAFTNGRVDSYTATAKGDVVYAVASQGIEPHSIWRYRLDTEVNERIVDGIREPFRMSRVIEPRRFTVTAFDGLEVPCYLYEPLELFDKTGKGKFSLKKKYPLVIYAPARTSAANWSFNARMQLLSNLGFFVLAVNYRGCEGYGVEYVERQNLNMAAQDLLAGRRMMLTNASVDSERVFLSSDSDGSLVVNELLNTCPDLWRGVSIENPAYLKWDYFEPSKLPPIFFAIGDQDALFPHMQQFEQWARTNGADVASVIYTNSGHITYKTSQRKDKLDKVASFLIRNL